MKTPLTPFYRWGSWGSEREETLLVSGISLGSWGPGFFFPRTPTSPSSRPSTWFLTLGPDSSSSCVTPCGFFLSTPGSPGPGCTGSSDVRTETGRFWASASPLDRLSRWASESLSKCPHSTLHILWCLVSAWSSFSPPGFWPCSFLRL